MFFHYTNSFNSMCLFLSCYLHRQERSIYNLMCLLLDDRLPSDDHNVIRFWWRGVVQMDHFCFTYMFYVVTIAGPYITKAMLKQVSVSPATFFEPLSTILSFDEWRFTIFNQTELSNVHFNSEYIAIYCVIDCMFSTVIQQCLVV